MQWIVEFILWEVLGGLGSLIKRLFGFKSSSSGISEASIGVLFCVGLIWLAIFFLR